MKKYPNEYNESVRPGILGRLLEKDKGEEVHWFETICKDEKTNGYFSITTPTYENLNLYQYKRLLLNKLKDTLEITNFNVKEIEIEILQKTLPLESYS